MIIIILENGRSLNSTDKYKRYRMNRPNLLSYLFSGCLFAVYSGMGNRDCTHKSLFTRCENYSDHTVCVALAEQEPNSNEKIFDNLAK